MIYVWWWRANGPTSRRKPSWVIFAWRNAWRRFSVYIVPIMCFMRRRISMCLWWRIIRERVCVIMWRVRVSLQTWLWSIGRRSLWWCLRTRRWIPPMWWGAPSVSAKFMCRVWIRRRRMAKWRESLSLSLRVSVMCWARTVRLFRCLRNKSSRADR